MYDGACAHAGAALHRKRLGFPTRSLPSLASPPCRADMLCWSSEHVPFAVAGLVLLFVFLPTASVLGVFIKRSAGNSRSASSDSTDGDADDGAVAAASANENEDEGDKDDDAAGTEKPPRPKASSCTALGKRLRESTAVVNVELVGAAASRLLRECASPHTTTRCSLGYCSHCLPCIFLPP